MPDIFETLLGPRHLRGPRLRAARRGPLAAGPDARGHRGPQAGVGRRGRDRRLHEPEARDEHPSMFFLTPS